jgi:hypothetical protein
MIMQHAASAEFKSQSNRETQNRIASSDLPVSGMFSSDRNLCAFQSELFNNFGRFCQLPENDKYEWSKNAKFHSNRATSFKTKQLQLKKNFIEW